MSFLKHYIHLEHHFVLQKYAEKTASLLRKGEVGRGQNLYRFVTRAANKKE